MSFVPLVPGSSDSPRVRELSERLTSVIREYQRQSGATDDDVRQALRLTRSDTTKSTAGRAVAMASGVALLIAIGVFALYLSRTQPEPGDVTAIPAVLLGLVVVVGLITYLRSR
ncbi:MAG: WHG domain-containing protein [Gemmatimonadetes bacterium]|uniref:WHG domain-containing protein n=1 Tax=Candidatus Kutchimonas denitrificans TaxID=3056748 RepID=A0AAE4Z768_9BACT|nr:WHG domain-containing protein [Gemmatimonadota bacterium]NIR74843.1 WHG domain-containing protein [Candidatus Kutchimonas denitrificans]NIR99954.1 WHG domain-containing protein [Gemmatimonadota bacterium]NIT65538.1 WHG domain-containing protein [Gemmatimonadota bacterium]NIU52508.1 hypothetical protein [Gemmatimonadota bacterium]